jgi:hypothetical protein
MPNPMIAIVNTADNTEIIREMTDEEYSNLQAEQAAIAASLVAQSE